MYSPRDFDMVTVAANMPDEEAGVLRFLQKKHATTRNLLFASDDTAKLQAAFDPEWQSAVPYTVVLGPDGKVIYKTLGSVNLLEMRRKILAAMPSDYVGFNRYWTTANRTKSELPDPLFYGRGSQISFALVSSRAPNAPSSRPKPEAFIPPKGARASDRTKSLIKTAPASN